MDFLRYLKSGPLQHVKFLIAHSTNEQIKMISALLFNFAHDRLPIKQTDIKRLLPFERRIALLADKRVSFVTKRRELSKQLKFIVLFLQIILPVIQS